MESDLLKLFKEKYNNAFEFESEKYPYLNVPKPEKREEYEVTNYSIFVIRNRYGCFSGLKMNNFENHRNQMTSSGAWLSSTDKDKDEWRIDIVADVFSSPKIIRKNFECNEQKLSRVVHTPGNIIPIPEGCNAGAWNPDYYSVKLRYIKEQFEKENIITCSEIENIKRRLDKKLTLGNIRKKYLTDGLTPFCDKVILRYWIKKCWKDKGLGWANFVSCLYLQDFVDDKLEVKELVFDDLIKAIISRSYRIYNKGEQIDPKELQEAFDSI